MASEPSPLDDVLADPLVLGVVQGDRVAWFQLAMLIEDWVSTRVPRHFRMRKAKLADSEDDVRDVLLEVIERVQRDDFRALRQYLEQKLEAVPDVREDTSEKAPRSFAGWLHGLVDYAIRDHVRNRYGRVSERPPSDDDPEPTISRRDLGSWAVHPQKPVSGVFGEANPALTSMLTARAILRYAEQEFAPRELSVFRRYLEQASFDELAAEFAFASKQEAEAEVRKLKERLRARFRKS